LVEEREADGDGTGGTELMNTKAAPAAWHDPAWQAVVDKLGRTSKRIGVNFPHASNLSCSLCSQWAVGATTSL
jgi:hypothetical protein